MKADSAVTSLFHVGEVRRGAFAATLALLTLLLLQIGCGGAPLEGESVGDDHLDEVASGLGIPRADAPYNEVPVEIVNVHSGKCLSIPGFSLINGTSADQYTCNGGTNQTWFLNVAHSDVSSGYYQIRAGHAGGMGLHITDDSFDNDAPAELTYPNTTAHHFSVDNYGNGYEIASVRNGIPTSKCLQPASASTLNHAIIVQSDCNGENYQRWTIRLRSFGMNLIAKHSDKCAEVTSSSTSNNALLRQFTCAKQGNQQWRIGSQTSVGTPYYTLVAGHSNKCMQIAGGSTADNANTEQFTCNGSDNQWWSTTEDTEGYVTFRNKLTNKCLSVFNSGTGDSVAIRQFTCNGGDNQRFWWSRADTRHVHVIELARSSGADRVVQSNVAISDQVARLNTIFRRTGLQLVYTPATDKSNLDSDTLYNWVWGPCPGLGNADPEACIQALAAANWANKVVVLSWPGGEGWSGGESHYIGIGVMMSASQTVCPANPVPGSSWLAHEYGHYMGLGHTDFVSGDDLLNDTRLNPGVDACLSTHTPTAVGPTGTIVDTDNVMASYNANLRITPQQASLVRHGAYARGY